ncbi:class I SAM-dependent methyltransferase [Flavisolibacter sp. BT320]|nr:class I SAM-dependent methyltransferase [Flavisolibacter longurius]
MKETDSFFVDQICPVCKTSLHTKVFSINHRQSQVLDMIGATVKEPYADIVKCKECQHNYMTPIISDEKLTHYYSKINSEFYANPKPEVGNINEKEYADYTKLIQTKCKTGKVLEIGCGKGYLLKTLQDNGFECYGVEPSPFAAGFAKETLNLQVENCFLHESSFFNMKFDIVVMIDVVEHISNMQRFMQQVSSVLKPGAIIFIGTGNIDSFNARFAGSNWGYFVSWEHVSFFNLKSMRALLTNFNYTDIEIRKTSLQHRPVKNTVEFIKNVAKKAINPFVRRKFYHGICYDHMIVMAKHKA